MTKKILAGVLSAVTLLSLSVTASATATPSPYAPDGDATSTLEAPGATTYKVDVGQLSCVLDVVVPTTIKAFLNPYNSEIQITDTSAAPAPGDKVKTGVTSYAYIVMNKSATTAVGIDIIGGAASGKGDVELLTAEDATKLAAANAMATADDAAKKKKAEAQAVYAGKKAYVALVAGAGANKTTLTGDGWANAEQQAAAAKATGAFTFDTEGFVTSIAATTKDTSATSATAPGVFVFTEDEKSLENFIKLDKASAAGNAFIASFAFAGICQNTKDASGEKEDWTAKDGLTLNFALKVHP